MKKLVVFTAVALIALSLSACKSTDVIAQGAQKSFDELVSANALAIETTEQDGATLWKIQSPGAPYFLLSNDSSASNRDAVISIDATDFISAGLDTSKLPETHVFDSASNRIEIATDYGDTAYKNPSTTKISDTFSSLLSAYRDKVGYHEVLDHFGIGLGGGNMFEWAKDITTNDKDVVFVLNPSPFIEAGVDPEKVANWIFTQVEIKDKAGLTEKVDKFLMPFNLK